MPATKRSSEPSGIVRYPGFGSTNAKEVEPMGGVAGRSTSAPSVSYVITNYNGMAYLPRTLEALYRHAPWRHEVIVVDDGSTDESREWLRSTYPDIRIVAFEKNDGNASRIRNAGMKAATARHVFVMDNDIEILPDCIETLMETLEKHRDCVCTTPRLIDGEEPDRLYFDGCCLHFLCLSGASLRREPVADHPPGPPFPSYGCGIMLIDLERLEQVGWFDEDYLRGWGNDGELHLRCRFFGLTALHTPRATATHIGRFHGSERAQGQITNRYRLMLTYYRWRTLLLLMPSLLSFELALSVGAVARGFWTARWEAVRATARGWRDIMATRRRIQARRHLADHEYLHGGVVELPHYTSSDALVVLAVRVFVALCEANWRIVRRGC
jgi:GT2 family glycosyltransferase